MKAEQAGFRLAIVDTPARIEQAAAEAARIADLVILPTKPSIYDLETLQASLELVKGRSQRPPVVVVNATPPHGGRYDQAVEAIKKMGLRSARRRSAIGWPSNTRPSSASPPRSTSRAARRRKRSKRSTRRFVDLSTCRHVRTNAPRKKEST